MICNDGGFPDDPAIVPSDSRCDVGPGRPVFSQRMRMMHWFEATAPIRLKLMVAFGTLTGLTAAVAVAAAFSGSWIIVSVGLAATAVSALLGLRFREAICRPYVGSVERMEAL